jgi:hypothetical protein
MNLMTSTRLSSITLRFANQIIRQFTAVTLFGLLFPLSFVIIFISNTFELIIDRETFFFLQRRPSPLGNASIGLWKGIIYFVFVLSIFTNSFIMSYLFDWYVETMVFGVLFQNFLFVVAILVGIVVTLILGSVLAGMSKKV